MVDYDDTTFTHSGKSNCSTSVLGLRASSPSSAVLQGATPSPWSYLDVHHPSADAWAGHRVDGTNAAFSATRRGTLECAVRHLLFGHNLQIGSSRSHLSTTSPVSCFRPWSAQGRHTMRSEKEAVGQSRARGSPEQASTALLPASLPPASQRRDLGRASPTSSACPKLGQPHSPRHAAVQSSPPRYAAAVVSLPQQNSVPSSHMRCRMQASLRASATFARLRPRRWATSRAQRLSPEKRTGRLSTALAAS